MELLVDLQGDGRCLRELFAVYLGLPPQQFAFGMATRAGAMPLPNRRMKSIGVEVRYGFASFGPLWGEMLAPPCDVIEIAENVATIFANNTH